MSKIVDHSPDAVLEARNVEIDEKTEVLAAQLQIGKRLGLVKRKELVNRFQLYDDCVLHEQIHSITEIEMDALVDQR
jgi:hypothetical protein